MLRSLPTLLLIALLATANAGNVLIIDVGDRVLIELLVETDNPDLVLSKLKEVLSSYSIEETRIDEIEERNIYSIKVWVLGWDKSVFQCDTKPVLEVLEKPVKVVVKGDNYLKITSIPTSGSFLDMENSVIKIRVKVDHGLIVLGLCGCYAPPIIMAPLVLLYIKRKLERIRSSNYYVVSEVLRRLNIVVASILVFVPGVSFIGSLFMTDYPAGIAFLTGIQVEVLLIAIAISFFPLAIIPLIYSMKYTAPLFGEEKVKRIDYLYSFTLFTPMIGTIVVILLAIMYMPSSIEAFLEKLPIPLRTATWVLLGVGTMLVLSSIVDRFITSRLERPLDPWVKEYVESIVRKLGLRRFKGVRVIRTIGGRLANAMVQGIFSKELVLTEKLLEVLDEEEVKAVIAHEVAHHKYKHIELSIVLWVVAGVAIFSGITYAFERLEKLRYGMLELWDLVSVLAFISLNAIGILTLVLVSRHVMRRAEDKADSEASKLIDNPETYIRALAKITIVDLGPMKVGKVLEKFDTHPSPVKRMIRIAKRHNIPESEVKEIISQVLKELTQHKHQRRNTAVHRPQISG